MKKYLIFILVLFVKTVNAQDSLSALKTKAVVYIIRNDFNAIFFTCDYYNNDKYIGGLKGFKYLKYECNAGKQLFWASADNTDFLELSLNSGETYIIEAEYKMGYYKGQVKLNLVSNNSNEYTYLKGVILNKEPVMYSPDEIYKKNIKRQKIILKSLKKYNSQKRSQTSFNNDTISTVSVIEIENKMDSIGYSPMILDYSIVDFPFSNKSLDISGVAGLITNPSMSQSLIITTSFNSFTREGLYRLMTKQPSTKRFYNLSVSLASVISYLPMPLTSGWLHEEFHRAVLAKHGGNSYNEMNNFPITKNLISVLDVKDANIIKIKHDNPQDMVRMSEAGIEGEYLLANNINKTAFFYNTKSITLTPILIALNSSVYVLMCSAKNIDKKTIDLNKIEGGNVKKRDLLGLDFLSYTYDLFRPYEPYQNRGIHPSGVGIDRYIKRSQLTSSEKIYLKQQGFLQLINLVNPISLMFTSFIIHKNNNGDDTRANIYFNHWLTSFGYDISTTALLHYNRHNYSLSIHNYTNYYNWFPGIELETYNYFLGTNILKKTIPISARMMAWLQPENQLFFSKNAQIGGLIEMKIYYPVNKNFYPYVSCTAKTNGWVAGNVYLERNISGVFGLCSYF